MAGRYGTTTLHNYIVNVALSFFLEEKWTQIAKIMWANMGPTWVLSAPAGPHVGPSLDEPCFYQGTRLKDNAHFQEKLLYIKIKKLTRHWYHYNKKYVLIRWMRLCNHRFYS